MLDPYCPVVSQVTVPDNVNLVPPRGGAAGSMPRNTPEVCCPTLQVSGRASASLRCLCCLHGMQMAGARAGCVAQAAPHPGRACPPLLLSWKALPGCRFVMRCSCTTL